MTRRNWGILVLIAFILVAVWAIVFKHDTAVPAAVDGAYQWRFTQWGTDERPQTKVVLVADGESHTIGTYDGSCAVMEGDYLEYETSRVACWYAGGGHEIGVFEEPGQVVVRVGDLDEGASGVEGFRGNFVLKKVIR
jgi:hypothetical protein